MRSTTDTGLFERIWRGRGHDEFSEPVEHSLQVVRKRKIRISFLFAWYDIWVGFYWDKKNKWLYFLPFPCVGLIFKFK